MQKKSGFCQADAEKNTVLSEQVRKCNSLSNEKKFKNNEEINDLRKKKVDGRREPLVYYFSYSRYKNSSFSY